VIRCTQKMLKRVGSPTTEPMASTTRLGDWTANLLGVGRQRFAEMRDSRHVVLTALTCYNERHLHYDYF